MLVALHWTLNVALRLEPSVLFYGSQAALLFVLWFGVRFGGGLDFYRFPMQNPVALRPSWLPKSWFLVLLQNVVYLPAAYSVTPLLCLAALVPNSFVLRICVAVAASAFHVAETSRTSSHWGYLMIYELWALAMFSGGYAQAIALALTVHFMSASGVAKLLIGGQEWVDLRAILRTFGAKRSKDGGPASPFLNGLIIVHRPLAQFLGAVTLLLECVGAPLVFLTPPLFRLVFLAAMLVLHVGIALLQSAAIGVFFIFPMTACYIYGLCAPCTIGEPEWCVAVAVWGALTVPALVRRRLPPEDWPLTPLALFPWAPRQWEALHARFVQGETRLVLATAETNVAPGMPVVVINYRTARGEAPPEGPRVYDMWSRLLGITTLQNPILEALDFQEMSLPGVWDATTFTCKVEAWLQDERLLELHTGQPLLRAYFVMVMHTEASSEAAQCSNSRAYGVVQSVICSGLLPE